MYLATLSLFHSSLFLVFITPFFLVQFFFVLINVSDFFNLLQIFLFFKFSFFFPFSPSPLASRRNKQWEIFALLYRSFGLAAAPSVFSTAPSIAWFLRYAHRVMSGARHLLGFHLLCSRLFSSLSLFLSFSLSITIYLSIYI